MAVVKTLCVVVGATMIAMLVLAPALAGPVKTTAVIQSMTRTSLPGDDAWTAKGKIAAADEACLKGRPVEILARLGPPFDSNALMQTVKADKRGRWKAEWTTRSGPGDVEEASTGVHYVEVEKLVRKKLKCSFARSQEYTVPAP